MVLNPAMSRASTRTGSTVVDGRPGDDQKPEGHDDDRLEEAVLSGALIVHGDPDRVDAVEILGADRAA